MAERNPKSKKERLKSISLYPLTLGEALRAFMQVKPKPKEVLVRRKPRRTKPPSGID